MAWCGWQLNLQMYLLQPWKTEITCSISSFKITTFNNCWKSLVSKSCVDAHEVTALPNGLSSCYHHCLSASQWQVQLGLPAAAQDQRAKAQSMTTHRTIGPRRGQWLYSGEYVQWVHLNTVKWLPKAKVTFLNERCMPFNVTSHGWISVVFISTDLNS